MRIILEENRQIVGVRKRDKCLIKCRQNPMWAIPSRSMSPNLYSVDLPVV